MSIDILQEVSLPSFQPLQSDGLNKSPSGIGWSDLAVATEASALAIV